MRRLPPIVFAFVALAPNAVNAQVVETCTFDEATATVTVVPAAGLAHLEVVNGDEIWEGAMQCGSASTSNTDTIVIHPSFEDRVEISLEGGAFAPGLTEEMEGSEIEFLVSTEQEDDFFELALVGSDGDDFIRAGSVDTATSASTARTFNHEARIDLDAGTTPQDADIIANQGFLVRLDISLGAGADRFSASGAVTGVDTPYIGGILVDGGSGDDRVDPAGIGLPTEEQGYVGGAGNDSLQLTWLGDDCEVILETDWAEGAGTIGGCFHEGGFPHFRFERFVGHDGKDTLLGDETDQELEGRGGDDLIASAGGADQIEGGGGVDLLALGEGNGPSIRVRLDTGVVHGDGQVPGIDHFSGVETVASLGNGVDRLVGSPMPRLRRLIGSPEGTDILDLRNASGPISLVAWDFPIFGDQPHHLWVHQLVVLGTPYDDVFTGHRGDDESNDFRGFDGDDALMGRGGDDRRRGGPGDDLIDGGEGIDACSGGDGVDSIKRCES